MQRNFLPSIEEREDKKVELMYVAILKDSLIKLFKDYIGSRPITQVSGIFRDDSLTQQKRALAEEMMEIIHKFNGESGDLVEQIKNMRIKNAEISIRYHKYHYNLLGQKTRPSSSPVSLFNKKISSWKSGFADACEKAITIIENNIPKIQRLPNN